jgi:hypothetical protein
MKRTMWGGALLLLAVSGCGVNRELQEQFVDLKNEFNLQLALLNRHGEFLEKKVAAIETKLAEAERVDRELSGGLAAYIARPDEVKREVLADATAEARRAEERQAAYLAAFQQRLGARRADIHRRAHEAISQTHRTLDDRERLFRFVFTAQDSVNRVFASRFDQRPWYQSVLGRWEDRRPSE